MDFGEESELEDLIEEIREQSNESYYPLPSKIFALLYLLVNSPHSMVVVPTNSIHGIATPPSFLVRWIAPVNFVRMDEEFNARKENIHFISCSDKVSSLELCKPIAQQLTMLETDGVVVFDALNQEEVLVVAPVLCIVCDNPMASKLCNHLGSSALKYCRLCMVDRTGDPYVICEKRCKCRAVEQMSAI
ncbi:hypothetical protein EMCRGX_G001454 [Ephydatia muelleri]